MSQKELQRVAVISSLREGGPGVCQSRLAARSNASACQQLKSRLRQGGEAALAHASRGDDHWTVEEQLAGRREPTQFGRALEQLGVTYIAAQSPQAKGRIERLWGTFQDRLTSELRLAGAADLAAANQVLRRFLPDHNRRFGRAPRNAEKAWRPAPENLDRICCFHHQRSVSNDNVVQWDGRRFQIPPQPHRFSFAGPEFNSSNHSKERSPSITAITSSTILRG